jgi:carboxyl-terminal processing protease
MSRMRLFRLFLIAFSAVVLLGIVFLGGYTLGDQRGQQALSQSAGFDTVWRVRDLLNGEFFGDIPTTQAQAYGAAHGLTGSFNDPYTVFVEPAPRTLERDELRGQFGGIGALLSRNQAGDLVMTPTRTGPAIRGGVKDGDILVAVDDKPIKPEMSVNDIIVLVRGDIGTKVKLTLRRAGQPGTMDVTVVREQIQTPSVDWRVLDQAHKLGYVRIALFGERTGGELQTALNELAGRGVDKLVLDLRGNGGGLLDAAVDTASQFLHEGLVLREVKRGGDEKDYQVKPVTQAAQGWPLVVLTDAGTASASEIVAGALRDYGRATLMGEKSYGKGSVQQVHELPDGSSLHVTVARWLTPNRHQIDKAGLQPDVAVPMTNDDRAAGRDPQLDRAQAWLTQGQVQAGPTPQPTPTR